MKPISTAAIQTRMMRSSIVKKNAVADGRSRPAAPKPAASLKRITAVHKTTVQVMPKRHVTLSKSQTSMVKRGSGSTSATSFKTTKPVSLRSPIKPRVAKKKLVLIKPVKKPLGRHMELTSRGLKRIRGHEGSFGPIYEPFAGATPKFNPFAIHQGANTMMSVPVDRPQEEPARSVRLYIAGIPAWLDPVKVYYDLLVYLAQHHLILSTLDFTSHADEGQAAWASVTLSFEAEQLLAAAGHQISHSAHQIFHIPASIKLSPPLVTFSVVEEVN